MVRAGRERVAGRVEVDRRLSRHRGKLFHRLMQQAVTQRPPAVKALYVPKPHPVGVA